MTLKNALVSTLFVTPFLTACTNTPQLPVDATYTTQSVDGVTVIGEPYLGSLDASAPLILLFHQGGSNGRAEYAPLVSELNEKGFRAIAWDLRSGGPLFGEENRTASALPAGVANGYCDAYPDMQAALDFVMAEEIATDVIVWGSSYSGALVFQLAANNPESVSGVLAFSPASGAPLENCRARQWVGEISDPILVFKPRSEMQRASSVEQRDLLVAAGVEVIIVEDGVHGSSMLVDERTGEDMTDARQTVFDWLAGLTG